MTGASPDPGIGKSHSSQALDHEAARPGVSIVSFKSRKLLILDEFPFRLRTQMETKLLYTISDERLGKAWIVVTSKRPAEDWFAVVPDPVRDEH
ncbi:MAG: ATP-binding protein [Spirochaetes bacterium]|nr:ATP-binding protein [Spirochaetota bacterium]